ncbi:MAG: elongation factor Ts [Burkholderiales bacterium]|nr:elongation factor Ts [Burkholderiales bacterium]
MAEVTATMVRELREITGLGMMECKKALVETGGDLKSAEDLLRIKSGAKANKAAGRVAAEGVIGAYLAADGKTAALVEVNCETDFVAKNSDFLEFASTLAQLVANDDPADVAALSALGLESGTVETRRQALVQKIGENLSIRRFHRLHTGAKLAQYLHGVKIGVLIEFEGEDEVGKDLAMHIAFARPQYMSRDQVSPDALARERDVLAARARESGKPANIAEKMVEGGMNKFLGEITLLGQAFVKDDKLTVEKMLAAKHAKLLSYKFFVAGEGIEKKASDFAAEVAAQAKAATS